MGFKMNTCFRWHFCVLFLKKCASIFNSYSFITFFSETFLNFHNPLLERKYKMNSDSTGQHKNHSIKRPYSQSKLTIKHKCIQALLSVVSIYPFFFTALWAHFFIWRHVISASFQHLLQFCMWHLPGCTFVSGSCDLFWIWLNNQKKNRLINRDKCHFFWQDLQIDLKPSNIILGNENITLSLNHTHSPSLLEPSSSQPTTAECLKTF